MSRQIVLSKLILLVLSCILLITLHEVQAFCKAPNEDASLSPTKLAAKYGYEMETYYVTAKDDYILCLHRIPSDRYGNRATNGAVVLNHSYLASAVQFVIGGYQHALAFVLADANYDVWLLNMRGSTYSRNHTTLNPDKDKKQFWNFTDFDLALDLQYVIAKVLSVTGERQIFYVGHSQGGRLLYELLATSPEYNAVIKAQFSLAPGVFLKHIRSPAVFLLTLSYPLIYRVLTVLNIHEFVPYSNWLNRISPTICSCNRLTLAFCNLVLFVVAGYSPYELDSNLTTVIVGHSPTGGSTFQLRSYLRQAYTDKFCQYDFGPKLNHLRYNSTSPDCFDLNLVTASTYLFYGQNDLLASPRDVKMLYKSLPPGNKHIYKVDDKYFNHLDFTWGRDAKSKVYDPILRILKQYNKSTICARIA